MKIKEAQVVSPVGLRSTQLDIFLVKANKFENCKIWIEKSEKRVNAKSLLGVISLGILCGDKVKIIADGTGENEAIDTLIKLVKTPLCTS